jgi:hypothetical protein
MRWLNRGCWPSTGNSIDGLRDIGYVVGAVATLWVPTNRPCRSHGRFSSSASCGVFRVSWWWVRHHGCLCRPESGENAARVWSAYDSLLWMLTPCQNAMWSRMCAACGLGCG